MASHSERQDLRVQVTQSPKRKQSEAHSPWDSEGLQVKRLHTAPAAQSPPAPPVQVQNPLPSKPNPHPLLPSFLGKPDDYPLTLEPPFFKNYGHCSSATPFDSLASALDRHNRHPAVIPSFRGASAIPEERLNVRENEAKARPILLGDTPQHSEALQQIESHEARRILLEAHGAVLGLAPNLNYSQAALSYGLRMEVNIALEMKFDQVLESMREQMVCIQFLARNFCNLVKL